MATTTFSSGTTVASTWLNDVDAAVYENLKPNQRSLFEWFTAAQIADYTARTAVSDWANALDLTTAIQTAMDEAYAEGVRLIAPEGAAKVSSLEIEVPDSPYEDRGRAWTFEGAGAPQPFVQYPDGGTLFIADNTAGPVLRYKQNRATPTASGNIQVKGIRFEQRNASSTHPVVLWDGISEEACFSYNTILQFGTGDGLKVEYHAKGNIEHNFVMYGGYFTSTTSSAGIGFNIPSAADGGMLTVKKNSARRWAWGYVHGDGTNDSSGALFEQNECSDCTNGIWNKAGCSSATFFKTYTEGITGTCIKDDGVMTTIYGGMHYLGFTIGIDASTTSNYGTTIEGNYLETAGPGCTLIKIGSGGPSKNVVNNHLLFSTSGGSVINVIGIEIVGADPRINIQNNAFDPRGAWVGGSGTIKVLNSATGTAVGSVPITDGSDIEYTKYIMAGIAYQQNANALTSADVDGSNVMTIPQSNVINLAEPTTATTVTRLTQSGMPDECRIVHFVTSNDRFTFQDSAYMFLNGDASWTGNSTEGGILTLLLTYTGGATYAKEISRTVF